MANLNKYTPKRSIYQIKCLKNKRIYIGQSNNVEYRIHTHVSDLLRHKGHNIELQNDFNEYGIKSFIVDVIKIGNYGFKRLLKEERKIIKQYHKDGIILYNLLVGTHVLDKSKCSKCKEGNRHITKSGNKLSWCKYCIRLNNRNK